MGIFSALFGPPAHVHDWEIIDFESQWAIECRVDSEHDDGPPKAPRLPSGCSVTYDHLPKRKVCMSCGEIRDEIDAYEREYRAKKQYQQARSEAARARWNECKRIT
jgi:hypothetical protein